MNYFCLSCRSEDVAALIWYSVSYLRHLCDLYHRLNGKDNAIRREFEDIIHDTRSESCLLRCWRLCVHSNNGLVAEYCNDRHLGVRVPLPLASSALLSPRKSNDFFVEWSDFRPPRVDSRSFLGYQTLSGAQKGRVCYGFGCREAMSDCA